MASIGLIVLLLVGIILMTGNAAKQQHTVPKEKVVYKHVPLDLEAFYKFGDIHKPSTLFYSVFNKEDIIR